MNYRELQRSNSERFNKLSEATKQYLRDAGYKNTGKESVTKSAGLLDELKARGYEGGRPNDTALSEDKALFEQITRSKSTRGTLEGEDITFVFEPDDVLVYSRDENRLVWSWERHLDNLDMTEYVYSLVQEFGADLAFLKTRLLLVDTYIALPWHLIEGQKYNPCKLTTPFKQFLESAQQASIDSHGLIIFYSKPAEFLKSILQLWCKPLHTGGNITVGYGQMRAYKQALVSKIARMTDTHPVYPGMTPPSIESEYDIIVRNVAELVFYGVYPDNILKEYIPKVGIGLTHYLASWMTTKDADKVLYYQTVIDNFYKAITGYIQFFNFYNIQDGCFIDIMRDVLGKLRYKMLRRHFTHYQIEFTMHKLHDSMMSIVRPKWQATEFVM